MASRRQARRDAMVVLYQHDLTGAGMDEWLQFLRDGVKVARYSATAPAPTPATAQLA